MAEEAKSIIDLDLSAPERPTVRLDQGDFKMRHPEEFQFRDFAKIKTIGDRITELVEAGLAENAEELDGLLGEGIRQIVVDPSDEVVASMTPKRFQRMFDFFNKLGPDEEDDGDAEASETASSSSPGASDSTEASEAD